ncbi:3-oxoacyl-ACP reductase [Leucobacter denitrificans]|uniref:3-oxoacyl-ACP reductase n=1 Tax=Leucobacter denitrificans TaxID=683042 RepID=A0A7G9S4H0_9MICO|nr:3-oxoacyl-ACP reductase [Leucobacter denitrificans]QNN62745.1 3-oxoacyl-ACP reductase [Leucobacter denitrificans]
MTDVSSPQAQPDKPQMPSSQPILMRAMKWGGLATIGLMIIFGVIGALVSGSTGVIAGVLGAAFSGLFLMLTVGSIAFANRFIASPSYIALFFGIVMGSWLLKFIVFIVVSLLLRNQDWLNPTIFFIAVVSGVIVSLVVDVLVITKSRIPVVSDPQ